MRLRVIPIQALAVPLSLIEFFSSQKFSQKLLKTFCVKKQLRITYFECVSIALVIPSSTKSTGAMLYWSPAIYPALPYFSMLPHKRHDFRKNDIEQKLYVQIFSTTLSETFLILRRIRGDSIVNVYPSLCKALIILFRF
jgi:hypothetical protein